MLATFSFLAWNVLSCQVAPHDLSMDFQVFHYDAFSTLPGKGNLAGVVFDATALSKQAMLAIAPYSCA